MDPPNIPHLTASNYRIFLSMTNDLVGEKLAIRETCDRGFYGTSIITLP